MIIGRIDSPDSYIVRDMASSPAIMLMMMALVFSRVRTSGVAWECAVLRQ